MTALARRNPKQLRNYTEVTLKLVRWKKDLRGIAGEFDELLDADVAQARQVLRKFLDGPIVFEPHDLQIRPFGRDRLGNERMRATGSYTLTGRTRAGSSRREG